MNQNEYYSPTRNSSDINAITSYEEFNILHQTENALASSCNQEKIVQIEDKINNLTTSNLVDRHFINQDLYHHDLSANQANYQCNSDLQDQTVYYFLPYNESSNMKKYNKSSFYDETREELTENKITTVSNSNKETSAKNVIIENSASIYEKYSLTLLCVSIFLLIMSFTCFMIIYFRSYIYDIVTQICVHFSLVLLVVTFGFCFITVIVFWRKSLKKYKIIIRIIYFFAITFSTITQILNWTIRFNSKDYN